jgi:hypothetical protein
MTTPVTSRKRFAWLVTFALLTVVVAAPRSGAAQAAKSPYVLSVFAVSENGWSQPDSIVQAGDFVYIGYQNHVAKDGSDGKSSTIVQYSLDGHVRRTWSVKGHHDGLRVINGTELWSVQNEDANPNLVIIDLASGRATVYSFPPTPHGGGYDDIVQDPHGQVYMTASNPNLDSAGNNVFPALVRVRVNSRRHSLDLTPVLAGNASAVDVASGAAGALNLTDPDSMTVDPLGNLVFTSQADGLLIFVRNPLTAAQQVASLKITSGGSATTLDDTQFVPAGAAYMLFSDVAKDTVYRLDRPMLGFEPGTAYSTSDTAGIVATLNPDTGVLTSVATGFGSTRGIAFILIPTDPDGD